ncbi:MAG: hypothetical protein AAGI34_19140 [Pseudomonadota bacterium]
MDDDWIIRLREQMWHYLPDDPAEAAGGIAILSADVLISLGATDEQAQQVLGAALRGLRASASDTVQH